MQAILFHAVQPLPNACHTKNTLQPASQSPKWPMKSHGEALSTFYTYFLFLAE